LSKSASRARLAEIIRKRSFGRGEITLASGRKSDFYFNLKPTMLDPEGAALLAELTFDAVRERRFYVLTHPKILASVQLRFDDVTQQRNPTDPLSLKPEVKG